MGAWGVGGLEREERRRRNDFSRGIPIPSQRRGRDAAGSSRGVCAPLKQLSSGSRHPGPSSWARCAAMTLDGLGRK